MASDSNMVTINDVAKACGLSKGTVDRVLHNRGEVSPKSREKVMKVIEELGYKPNVYASLLASQKRRVICCLIPEYGAGDFWSLTAKGLAESEDAAARYGVTINTVTYDQYEIESFRSACRTVLEMAPSGVIIAPMFKDETLVFTAELTERDIPYVYIDTRIEDDQNYFAYFGMPMFQSGYLCADILMNDTPVERVYVVRVERDKAKRSDPTAARRSGFMKYMEEYYPQTEVVNVFINPQDRDQRFAKLDEAFAGDSGCKHIVMFNSRIHLVADYVRERAISGNRIVGFDCIEKNLAALRDGTVQVLITQHSDRHASSAVNALVDKSILGTDMPRRNNFSQMDILNRYNCEFYM